MLACREANAEEDKLRSGSLGSTVLRTRSQLFDAPDFSGGRKNRRRAQIPTHSLLHLQPLYHHLIVSHNYSLLSVCRRMLSTIRTSLPRSAFTSLRLVSLASPATRSVGVRAQLSISIPVNFARGLGSMSATGESVAKRSKLDGQGELFCIHNALRRSGRMEVRMGRRDKGKGGMDEGEGWGMARAI